MWPEGISSLGALTQVNTQRLKETRHVYCLVIVAIFVGPGGGTKRLGFFKVIKLSYGRKGKSRKQEELLIKVLWGAIKNLPKEVPYLESERLYHIR